MIGTFTFLNTFTLHVLRLTPSLSKLRERIIRLSRGDKTALRRGRTPRGEYGDVEQGYFPSDHDSGERRWQAAVAGAVGSLGLLWEEKGRRIGVSQQ